MNHKISTIILIFLCGALFFSLADALSSSEIDLELCNTPNSLIKRIGGFWVCNPTAHAEGFYHSYDTPVVLDISVNDTYVNVTGANFTHLIGFGFGDSGLVAQKSSYYSFNADFSFNGGNNGIYEFELHVNDVPVPKCGFFRSTSTTAIGVGAISCHVELEEEDYIRIKVKDVGAPPQDVSIYQLNVNVKEIQ